MPYVPNTRTQSVFSHRPGLSRSTSQDRKGDEQQPVEKLMEMVKHFWKKLGLKRAGFESFFMMTWINTWLPEEYQKREIVGPIIVVVMVVVVYLFMKACKFTKLVLALGSVTLMPDLTAWIVAILVVSIAGEVAFCNFVVLHLYKKARKARINKIFLVVLGRFVVV